MTEANTAPIPAEPPPCRHTDLLREIAARLEAIGSPAAALALDELAASAVAHIETVEATIALVLALEAAASIH